MEIKKSPKADLEGKKQISLLMGYVIALAVLFVAFEWGTRDLQVATDDGVSDIIAEEEIEITMPEELPPPPPPPAPVVVDILNVVEDDVVVDTEIVSTEDASDAAQVETYTPPVVEEEEEDPNQIFKVVEKQAEFPGGEAAMYAFIQKTLKYPVVAAENGLKGRVTCEFTINKDGSIEDVKVLKGVDPSLDKEAIRVISAMPKWKPGEQRGKAVRVSFTLPITFKLQN